jgi:HEAT repeat protein
MLYRLLVLFSSTLIGWPQSATLDSHIDALKGDDFRARIRAATALEKLGPKAEPAIPALIGALDDIRGESMDVRVGTLCARALVAIGKPAREPIFTALKSRNIPLFTGAAQAVMIMEPLPEEALPTLFAAVNERTKPETATENPRQRCWVATEVLQKYGKKALPVRDSLLTMLQSDNFREQISASQLLAMFGAEAAPAAPRLIQLAKEGNTSARGHACLALGQIGLVEKLDVVSPIETATEDFSAVVRERAMAGLAMLGSDAKSALPTVHRLLRSKRYGNRVDAAYAAFRITGEAEEPLEVLIELAADRNHELDALQLIGKMGAAAEPGVEKLLKLLDSEDPDKRFELAQTLKRVAINNAKVRRALARLATSDPDADVRRIAKVKSAASKVKSSIGTDK